MKKQSKGTLISIAFVALFILGRFYYFKPAADNGEQAPELKGLLLDGSSFDLNQLKGNYVLVDFWGSWCAPCRRENPNLVYIHNEFKDKIFTDSERFEIVSVAIDKNEASLKNAIIKDKLDWPYHIFDKATNLRFFDGPISDVWGINEVPQKFLVGPDGEILLSNPTISELRSFLITKLDN